MWNKCIKVRFNVYSSKLHYAHPGGGDLKWTRQIFRWCRLHMVSGFEDRRRFRLTLQRFTLHAMRWWMRTSAALRSEVRDGGWRKNSEGWRRKTRSSCGFVLAKGWYGHPPFPLHSSNLPLLLEPQQGNVNVTWLMLILEDGNQFGSRTNPRLCQAR